MRYPTLILALTGASFLTGCSSLVSLNPFIADGSATDAGLIGAWKNADPKNEDMYLIKQDGASYAIKYIGEKNDVSNFRAQLAKIGDAEFLDLVTADDTPFTVPVHVLVRVWPGDDKMQWAFLDSDWMRQQAKQSLATQENSDRTLITHQGDAVAQFLKKFGTDDRAHGEAVDLVKAH